MLFVEIAMSLLSKTAILRFKEAGLSGIAKYMIGVWGGILIAWCGFGFAIFTLETGGADTVATIGAVTGIVGYVVSCFTLNSPEN